ncbi:unnamed protein product [Rotaria sp. Silwood1]|nr:unnamed protein product [Rotaria sp. Silwood1]
MAKIVLSVKKLISYNTIFRPVQSAWKRSLSTEERQVSSKVDQSCRSQNSSGSTTNDIAPGKHSVTLILIDVINHPDFEGNEGRTCTETKQPKMSVFIALLLFLELIKVIKPIGQRIAELRKTAYTANIPTIFVNDNS